MGKETIVELELDVAGWITERNRVMHEIECAIYSMFLAHQQNGCGVRRTGCFHVELSLPEVEPLPNLNVHPTGPQCTEACLHGFGCGWPIEPRYERGQ